MKILIKLIVSYYEPHNYIKYKNQCISGIENINEEDSLHYLTLINVIKIIKK